MSALNAAQLIKQMRTAAAEALNDGAELVRDVTRERTPDDPATSGEDLPGSLTVDPATPDHLESKVYTGSEYALYQHENLTLDHPTGQSKYLETGTIESRTEVEQAQAAAVRRRFG